MKDGSPMRKVLAHCDREPTNVMSALDELYEAERKANAARDTLTKSPSARNWRAFCQAAVEATSARSIVESATGLPLRRVPGGRFHTVVDS